jgi:hypothetical protein
LCSILDGYSRFIVHWEIRKQMQEGDVETIIQRAREMCPSARPRIISDNGPQFIAKDFKEFIRISGMTHVKTSPYYPQSNGKIERWHKTLKGESIRISVPLSLDDARRIVADYTTHYNTVRLHSAVGYVTPKDKLDGKDQEIFDQRDRKLAAARERRQQLRQARRPQTPATPEVTPRPAIDFAAIKAAVNIAAVLQLLGATTGQTSGNQYRGPCPLHGSSRGTARCFTASLDANLYRCFKCGQTGDAIDLWAQATRQTPYDAAVDLCQRLNVSLPLLPSTRSPTEPVIPTCQTGTMASPHCEASP